MNMGCTSSAPQWIVHKSISVGQDGLPLPPDPVSTIANPGADLARTASRDCKPNTVVTLEFECLDDSTDGMATLAGFGLSNSEYDPTIPMSRARECVAALLLPSAPDAAAVAAAAAGGGTAVRVAHAWP